MFVEKKRKFIINVLYIALISAIIYVIIKYGLECFFPFIIGFFIAFLLKPLINYICKKTGISKKIIAVFIILIFFLTAALLIVLIGMKLFVELKEIFIHLPELYYQSILPFIYNVFTDIESFYMKLDPTMVNTIRDITLSLSKSLGQIISNVSSKAIDFITSFMSFFPSFLIFIVLSIISSFFIAIDYDNISRFILKQFSINIKLVILDIKNCVIGSMFKFLKAYSVLMLITFIEIFIGLTILGVDNPLGIACIIATLDILPVIGTGSILIPWSIIEFLKGNPLLFIGLLSLYTLVVIVRNVIEPKIVGEQVGLHPLVMLICMFVGAKMFGFAGIFILPIIVIVIKSLNDSGKIDIFK